LAGTSTAMEDGGCAPIRSSLTMGASIDDGLGYLSISLIYRIFIDNANNHIGFCAATSVFVQRWGYCAQPRKWRKCESPGARLRAARAGSTPIGCSLRAFAREAYPAQCKGCGNRPSFRRQLAQHHRDLTRSSHEKFSPHRPGHVICRLSMVAHGAHTCPWKEVANSLNLAPAASNASRQRNIADAPRLNSSVWIEVVSHELIAQQDSFATP
jgi:hypothetical protein